MKASDQQQSMRDRTRERAKRRSGGGLSTLTLPDGVDLMNVKDSIDKRGRVSFDILPYRITVDTHPEVRKGDLWWERTYLAHRAVGPEEKFIICPRTIGKACPICEEHNRLKKDPDAEKEVVDALRAKERQLFNVLLDGEDSPRVLDMSTFLFGRKLEEEIRDNEENSDFSFLKGGKTLQVRFSEETMGDHSFLEATRIDFLERETDFPEDVLDTVVNLDEAMIILSYEEIEALMAGNTEDEDKPKRGKKPEAEADDDDDAAEDDPKPKARTIRRGGKPADAATTDDDAEDDPKPKKGKKPEAEDDADAAEDDDNICVACEGRGKTSKGKTCPVCEGTGKLEAEEPAADDAEEDPKPKKGKKPEAEDDDDAAADDDDKPKTRRIIHR